MGFFLQNCNFVKKCIFTKIFRFLELFLGLIISIGALVCKLGKKCVLNSVSFLVEFFRLFTENGNIQFLTKIDSATCFGLITHIIKLFQTAQIQKARLKICQSKCHLKI